MSEFAHAVDEGDELKHESTNLPPRYMRVNHDDLEMAEICGLGYEVVVGDDWIDVDYRKVVPGY